MEIHRPRKRLLNSSSKPKESTSTVAQSTAATMTTTITNLSIKDRQYLNDIRASVNAVYHEPETSTDTDFLFNLYVKSPDMTSTETKNKNIKGHNQTDTIDHDHGYSLPTTLNTKDVVNTKGHNIETHNSKIMKGENQNLPEIPMPSTKGHNNHTDAHKENNDRNNDGMLDKDLTTTPNEATIDSSEVDSDSNNSENAKNPRNIA